MAAFGRFLAHYLAYAIPFVGVGWSARSIGDLLYAQFMYEPRLWHCVLAFLLVLGIALILDRVVFSRIDKLRGGARPRGYAAAHALILGAVYAAVVSFRFQTVYYDLDVAFDRLFGEGLVVAGVFAFLPRLLAPGFTRERLTDSAPR